MARAPQNLPAEGDRCRLRGRQCTGTVGSVNARNWTLVVWDGSENEGPKICHLYELEKIETE